MADQFLPDQATAQNLQFILPILYKADQDAQKQKLDPQTATAIWDWATNNFKDIEIKEFKEDPEGRPFLVLAVRVLGKVNKNDFKVASNSEKMRALDEAREKENREKKAEAEAKLAKLDKQPRVTEVLRQIRQSIATADPQSAAPPILASVESSIAWDATLYPVDTTQGLTQVVQTTSQAIPEASWTMTPLVKEVVIQLEPEIAVLAEAVTQKIQEAGPIPAEAAEAGAARIIAYKLANPKSPPETIKKIIDGVALKFEADGYPTSSLDSVQQEVEKLDLTTDLPEKIEATIALELQQQANLDSATAKEIAKLVVFTKLPDISYAVAKAAPGKPNETLRERQIRQENIFTKINNSALQSFRQLPSASLNQLLKKDVNFGRVYMLLQQYSPPPPPIYQEEDYQTRDEQGGRQSNQVVDYFKSEIQGRIQDRVKDEIWQAADGWINGSNVAVAASGVTGGVVGSAVGADIVAYSTALALAQASATPTLLLEGLPLGYELATYYMGNAILVPSAPVIGALGTLAPSVPAAGTALTVASTGAEVATGTALGTVTGGIIGAAIAAIVTWIVTNLPKIWKWIKDKFEQYIFPLIGGLLLLGASIPMSLLAGFGAGATAVVGMLSFGAGAMVGSQIPTFVSGGAQAVLQPIGAGATKVFASLTELAVVEIATPIIIIILSIPIVVALLLFIINTSAYVVPVQTVNTVASGPGPGGKWPKCWPAEGRITQRTCADYPTRPYSHCSVFFQATRNAIDIGAPLDTPIYATHDGLATPRRFTIDGYGNFVKVTSTEGFATYYAHMDHFAFENDREVTAGTLIGYIDMTGFGNGNHVHYGLESQFSIRQYIPQPDSEYRDGAPTLGCQARDEGGSNTP